MIHRNSVAKLPALSSLHLGWAGLALGVGFWFLESALHAFVFDQHAFVEELVPEEANEFWMRLLVSVLFLSFGLAAHKLLSSHRVALERIQDLENELVAMFDGIRDPIFLHDPSGRILSANRAFLELSAVDLEKIKEVPYWKLNAEFAALPHASNPGAGKAVSEAALPIAGRFWMARSFPVEGRHSSFSVQMLVDVTAEKEAEKHQLLAAKVMEVAPVGIVVTDPETRILAVNPAFVNITGYAAEEVIGHMPTLLQSGRQGREFYDVMWNHLRTTGFWSGEIWNKKKSGEIYPEWLQISTVRDAERGILHYIGVFSDISLRKKTEEVLITHANQDALTGLANRRVFAEELPKLLWHAKRDKRKVAILFLDLDRFKPINDMLGHEIGDAVLRAIAGRISESIRPSDLAARYGGDEFVIAVDCNAGLGALREICERLLRLIREPIHIHYHKVHVGGSIGVSIFPGDGQTVEELISKADSAMYQAKKASGLHFYSEEGAVQAAGS